MKKNIISIIIISCLASALITGFVFSRQHGLEIERYKTEAIRCELETTFQEILIEYDLNDPGYFEHSINDFN